MAGIHYTITRDWYKSTILLCEKPVALQRGQLDLTAMVTTRFPLDQINEATDALQSGRIAGRSILTM